MCGPRERTSFERVPLAVTPDAAGRTEEGSAALKSPGSTPGSGWKLSKIAVLAVAAACAERERVVQCR
jgi:hypothetical protein